MTTRRLAWILCGFALATVAGCAVFDIVDLSHLHSVDDFQPPGLVLGTQPGLTMGVPPPAMLEPAPGAPASRVTVPPVQAPAPVEQMKAPARVEPFQAPGAIERRGPGRSPGCQP